MECIKLFKEILCIAEESLVCRLAKDLITCIEKNCPLICLYSILKIIYEVVGQETYYRLIGVGDDEFQRILSKRSREYASFKTWMITKLKGVDGVTRKKLLRLYLTLSNYVHPSTRLYEGLEVDNELILRAMDAIVYMITLGNNNYLQRLCGIADPEKLSRCLFVKTSKRVSKYCIEP
ncbi:hypothetical protein J4526_06170 [Desulfurococcaceae archaeon MEX13E-LK6-19]|nr:hypothetical protein J4526_06170 [Desulfurococcaceae archaeon MEX13E-LK6-19]